MFKIISNINNFLLQTNVTPEFIKEIQSKTIFDYTTDEIGLQIYT